MNELANSQLKIAHEGHACLRTKVRRCQSWGWDYNDRVLSKGSKTCHICHQFGNIKRGVKFPTINNSKWPGKVIGIDFIGPINGIYILVKAYFMTRMIQLDMFSTSKAKAMLPWSSNWRDGPE